MQLMFGGPRQTLPSSPLRVPCRVSPGPHLEQGEVATKLSRSQFHCGRPGAPEVTIFGRKNLPALAKKIKLHFLGLSGLLEIFRHVLQVGVLGPHSSPFLAFGFVV